MGDSSKQSGNRKKTQALINSRRILTENTDGSLFDKRLDVPSYVESRKFEIQSLGEAMLKSKSFGKKRVFQSLPRILRRRAASHNVKRIPKNMRKRAEYEMDVSGDKAISVKEKKRNKDRKKEEAKIRMEKKRQEKTDENVDVEPERMDVDQVSQAEPDDAADPDLSEMVEQMKTAKDSTGINSLATPPKGKLKYKSRQKTKVWLPTHVWHAKRTHMENIWGYSVPRTPTQKCYRATHRAGSFAGLRAGTLAWDKSYFATLVLESSQLTDLVNLVTAITQSTPTDNINQPRYTKGYRCWEGILFNHSTPIGPGLVYFRNRPESEENAPFSVLIRFHPAIFSTVYDCIHSLISSESADITLYDCRYSIGSIEILGPQSTNSLVSILRCVDPDSVVSKTWRSLAGLANPSSLPKNAVISMNIHDPGLFYPPHKPQQTKATKDGGFSSLIANWPNDDMVQSSSSLFTVKAREDSYHNQLDLKKINKRRTQSKEPGKHLKPQPDDPHIPILLLRTEAKDGWTLLAPWGWILPLWYSLLHFPEVQVAGYNQEHQLCFEHGKPFFPDDYPGTEAGHAINWNKSKEVCSKWKSKPPAKRVAFNKVSTGSKEPGEHGDPFQCDWNHLNNLYNANTQQVESSPLSPPAQLSQFENHNRSALPAQVAIQAIDDKIPLSALAISIVKIKYIERGSPSDRARIYRIPDCDVWKAFLKRAGKHDEAAQRPSCPSDEYLIGYITSGDYNLAQGSGSGIANIVADHATNAKDRLCLVRNVGSSSVNVAKWTKI